MLTGLKYFWAKKFRGDGDFDQESGVRVRSGRAGSICDFSVVIAGAAARRAAGIAEPPIAARCKRKLVDLQTETSRAGSASIDSMRKHVPPRRP